MKPWACPLQPARAAALAHQRTSAARYGASITREALLGGRLRRTARAEHSARMHAPTDHGRSERLARLSPACARREALGSPSSRSPRGPALCLRRALPLTRRSARTAAVTDWLGLRTAIDAFLTADLRRATATLRLSFHSGGTFVATQSVGGVQCPVDLTAPANRNLETVVPALQALAAQFNVSNADVYTLAGVRAVTVMLGPTIPWRAGRVDLPCLTAPAADDVLPDAMIDGFSGAITTDTRPPTIGSFAPASMRAKFARMALNDVDTVALLGAHTVGHCHVDKSGFFGAWTTRPFLFTNEFFVGFATTPRNDLSAQGAAQFTGAWRADAITTTLSGTVTQFRDGNFAPLDGTQANVVPATAVNSTAYTQPVIQPRITPPGPAPPGGTRPDYMRLATDMALIADPAYLALVRSYAADAPAVGTLAVPTAGSLAFFAAFASSMQKLQELGVPSPNTQLFTPSFTALPPGSTPTPSVVASPPPSPPMPPRPRMPPNPPPLPPSPAPPPPADETPQARVVTASVGLRGPTAAAFRAPAFRMGMASLLGLDSSAITVNSVTDYVFGATPRDHAAHHLRRLSQATTGVLVAFSVEATLTAADSTALAASITTATSSRSAVLLTNLQAAGVTGVTALEAPTTPSVALASTARGALLAGAAALACPFAAALFA
jgi:hypothetical protein